MDGQVMGGGVIVLVAALLWLVYLLPSWHARHQFNAAERNAVRLNQALRILAETSETPVEVELELNARTALAQQKLAKRVLAEKQKLAKQVEAEEESARLEEARSNLEAARQASEVVRQAPAARRSRARRRARLMATVLFVAGLALVGLGVWQVMHSGAQLWLWVGGAVSLLSLVVLQRMASIQTRAARRVADAAVPVMAAERADTVLQDVELEPARATWTPRPLPQPLASAAGSRAATALAAAEARASLRQAARDEELRERAERMRPAPTPIPRRVAASSPDEAIEAHVRELLRQRAVGE